MGDTLNFRSPSVPNRDEVRWGGGDLQKNPTEAKTAHLMQNWAIICYLSMKYSFLKGHWTSLQKCNITLFMSNSIEDFKLNHFRNFQLIKQMGFHFMRYFVISIIFRVSHRVLYCVFIEVDFEKQKILGISIFLQK